MENILHTRGVTKAFGGVKALHNVSIDVLSGKITALIGPNGSGKSTLFEIISGLQKQDQGKLYFREKEFSKLSPYRRANQGIARTFQQVRLFKNLELADHIEFAVDNGDTGFFKNLFTRTRLSEDKLRAALDKVGLDKRADTQAHNLSYGQRKLLDLAVALAKPHDLLMLDEPVAGVTPKLRTEIKRILLEEKKAGKSILLIEHDMDFVMGIADIVYVLGQGEVIAKGTPNQVKKNKAVLEAYLGE
ncbi:MAG: ABC transporter ATP-binding protein [Candidatus ainarchaeum sp.]|nr:ABC transporter ATP-binding protein [Candidatus ainarchaeum sp.]